MDDQQILVARAVRGEREATEQLLERVLRIARRYCRTRLFGMPGGEHTAEDVAQEVCLGVLGSLSRYRDEGRPFDAFVYRIAAHKVADAQRGMYRSPEPIAEVPDRQDTAPGPETLTEQLDDAHRMRELLAQLPQQQREILILRIVVGMSGRETAQALGMSEGAVRVAQHRGMNRLREVSGLG